MAAHLDPTAMNPRNTTDCFHPSLSLLFSTRCLHDSTITTNYLVPDRRKIIVAGSKVFVCRRGPQDRQNQYLP